MARAIKEAVSDAIQNHLSDPRIEGFISVTNVIITPDLRDADVFLSIMAAGDAVKAKTFSAINHATKRIRMLVGRQLNARFCPTLRFHEDKKFKETIDTLRLIDEARRELEEKKDDKPDDVG